MIRTLYLYAIILACASLCSPALAVKWPWADGMTARCLNGAANCDRHVEYSWSGVIMVDAPEGASNDKTTQVHLYGVHCDKGDRPGNFRDCTFSYPALKYGHAPAQVGKCETKTASSWELTDDSICELQPGPVDPLHVGAFLGAECAVFAKGASGLVTSSVSTPWGNVTAEQVANMYSTYCRKAPPSQQECRIDLPDGGVIDHGTMPPTGTDTRKITATIECGGDEVLIVMGNGEVDLGRGIKSRLSAGRVTHGTADIVSVLTLVNAEPGPHSGVLVATVSPR